MIYALLIFSFLCVGFFGFGGPEAVLATINHLTIEENHWLTPTQFADLLIVSRFVPGETALNAATLSGYAATLNEYGLATSLGASLAAMIGLAAPSYIWAELTHRLRIPKAYREGFAHGIALIKSATPGLIGAIAIILCTQENIGSPEHAWHLGVSLFIILFTLIGNVVFRINAAALLVLSALAGILLL